MKSPATSIRKNWNDLLEIANDDEQAEWARDNLPTLLHIIDEQADTIADLRRERNEAYAAADKWMSHHDEVAKALADKVIEAADLRRRLALWEPKNSGEVMTTQDISSDNRSPNKEVVER